MSGGSSTTTPAEALVQQCGLHPMVAVLSTAGVDAICKSNNLNNVADLLAPFANVSFVIKDPYGQSQQSKVKIDFRDVAKSGCLWSLTVLPSVLHQVVSSVANTSSDVWKAGFRDAFCYWLEPAENDFFKTYICCIFFISAEEDDPMGELTKLVQAQNAQQHGTADTNNSLGPAHCASPKWFLPNILKHYVVLHDVNCGNAEKAEKVYSSMCSTYDAECCHILKVNSTNDADLPDPWHQLLEERYRGLDSGLELARRKLLERRESADAAVVDSVKSSSLMPFAMANVSSQSPVFSTSAAAAGVPLSPSLPQAVSPSDTAFSQVNSSNPISLASLSLRNSHGQCLSTTDREQLREFVEDFVKKSVVPFVEKQLSSQNEILQNRRGIGKSFTSIKKWLSSASSTTNSIVQPINYGAESAEIQTRRLADLAFLFGLYPFAHQLYQSIKKDFANDQAWLYHAGALEMAALTLYLSSSQLSPRQFPLHYLDNALNYYLNTCMQPMLAVRCAAISVEVLSRIGMHLEAANQLIRLTSTLSDLFSGVLLEKAAILFGLAKNFRRKAFHLVLAGHRFNQAGQAELSLKCYDTAASEYFDKGWNFAEDHIMFTLSHESADSQYQADCATKLVRHESGQYMDQQAVFIEHYLEILQRNNVENPSFAVPSYIPNSVRVIYGEKPEVYNVEPTGNGVDVIVELPTWEDLERVAYHGCLGQSKPFLRECPMYSDASTNNHRIKETPPFERFRVQFKLENPMHVPLMLRNIHLGIKNVTMKDGHLPSEAFSENGSIPELVLPATELPVYNGMNIRTDPPLSESLIELHLIPSDKVKSFSIGSVNFSLSNVNGNTSLLGHLPLNVQGKRLFKRKEHRRAVMHAEDCRLMAHVSGERWPLLNIDLSGQAARSEVIHAYCSQIFQVIVILDNVGHVPVNAISIATDQPEFVSLSESSNAQQGWSLCAAKVTSNNILLHSVSSDLAHIPVGGKLKLRMAIKAPQEIEVDKQYRIMFTYSGPHGFFREFRYSIRFTTQPLLRCVSRVLKPNYRLYAIDVKNLVPFRDAILAKVELLRLSGILTSPKYFGCTRPEVDLELVVKQPVVIESDQSHILPFYVCSSQHLDAPKSTLWLTNSIPDLPSFNNVVQHCHSQSTNQQERPCSPEATSKSHIQFSLLWKAHIANSDGTVATLFGESCIYL